jgi:molybdenum cofactor cytidylyltransferase
MICAIVPAAGRSSRMGTQKLLLEFAGTTVIGHIVDQLLASRIDSINVVVGHQADRIADELTGRDVSIVANPNPREGMLSSVRCGLEALGPDCNAVLVALGDQPTISATLVDRMIQALAIGGKGIVVPVHDCRRGHPLLFRASYRDEILTHYDDVGLRGLLRGHRDDIIELPADNDTVLSDMDYPDDYDRMLKNHGPD